MKREIYAVLVALFLISGCTLRPTYVVSGHSIGSPKGVRVAFNNGNPPEMFVSYRIFVDDPYGKHNIVVVAPGDSMSSIVRVPIGRVRLYYEVYHNATYMTDRVRYVLIYPPRPGTLQQFTIVEPR